MSSDWLVNKEPASPLKPAPPTTSTDELPLDPPSMDRQWTIGLTNMKQKAYEHVRRARHSPEAGLRDSHLPRAHVTLLEQIRREQLQFKAKNIPRVVWGSSSFLSGKFCTWRPIFLQLLKQLPADFTRAFVSRAVRHSPVAHPSVCSSVLCRATP